MIFINYRREDTKEFVTHFHRLLVERYGPEAVFVDYQDIPPGERWPDVLRDQLGSRGLVLVVVGPRWGEVRFDKGRNRGRLRLDDPTDWVREEICTALRDKKAVFVVLVGDAVLPETEWSPPECELNQLSTIQHARVRHQKDFSSDFSDLCEALEARTPGLKPRVSPAAAPPPAPKTWSPADLYPLQPAPHFAGRERLLGTLSAWAAATEDPTRVIALVAAGGTGKTALAERVLSSLAGRAAAGIFVWGFYENRQTEAFLRDACKYFLGDVPADTGGLLEHLQHGLRRDPLPHLLILDGLELVQASGVTGRGRGTLDDPLMRRFLRWLAAGMGSRTKALITSRFPLPELADWAGRGFVPIELDDLDPPAARALLRKRGVSGPDEVLERLADRVHGHALTIDVLGLYLHRFCGGNPSHAPQFDLNAAKSHHKGKRLWKVLESYAAKLPNDERDLLARLSVFPRGVSADDLRVVIAAGRDVAGSLIGCTRHHLIEMLESLCELGLVFHSDGSVGKTYSAHPFLREFFGTLLGATRPEQVHETLRMNLAPSLEKRPGGYPTSPPDLAHYERLIEVSRLAGSAPKAYELYERGLGNFEHLGWVLGDNARGQRILSGFLPDGVPAQAVPGLADKEASYLLNDWGLFAVNLGDLETARQAFDISTTLQLRQSQPTRAALALLNLAHVELLAGHWPAARAAATQALRHTTFIGFRTRKRNPCAYAAAAAIGLGLPVYARQQLDAAHRAEDQPYLSSLAGVHEAEWNIRTGKIDAARRMTELNEAACARAFWKADVAVCQTVLGTCAASVHLKKPRNHLRNARDYAGMTGDIEVTLRCYLLASEIERRAGVFSKAVAEAEDGIHLADSCGFGRWSLDIRTELAKVHIAAEDYAKAVGPAEWVLRRSREEDCQYAWGVADSLHLLGVAHARLGDVVKAREYLYLAVEKRKPLEHAGLAETEAELAKL